MPDIYIDTEKGKGNPSTPLRTGGVKEKEREIMPSRHDLPGHSHNPLATFCYRPDNVNFETQESGEKVVLFLRPHIVTNIPWVILAVLLFLAPAVLGNFPLLSFLPFQFQTVVVLGWYLVTAAFILENFLTWFFNVYIVTDERIIDIDFYNLIYREVSETKIDKIQDVTYKMGGVVRAVFNYGDVFIQTAGTVPNFEFMAVPRPEEVVKVLQSLRMEEEQEAIEGRVR